MTNLQEKHNSTKEDFVSNQIEYPLIRIYVFNKDHQIALQFVYASFCLTPCKIQLESQLKESAIEK